METDLTMAHPNCRCQLLGEMHFHPENMEARMRQLTEEMREIE
jgi:hypothetical protein